jgi:ABC-2 type transport system ATP-binding protein
VRIELRDVHKRFGKAHVLRGVTAEVPTGRRVALVGPNGSGKSTLIRALLGLLECEGTVLLDGQPPFEDRLALARRFAYVPQVAPQLSASVKEILDLVCLTRGMEPQAIDAMATGLDLDLRPIGERPFRNLSGGMKQKLLLAIALAARPSLLVMDEPTASLDARSRERFFGLFSQVPPEVTVLLCSHRLEELENLTSHVLALEEGRVTFDGPADTLHDATGKRLVEVLLAARGAGEELQ